MDDILRVTRPIFTLLTMNCYSHGTDSRIIRFLPLCFARHIYHPESLGSTSVTSRPFGSSSSLSFRLLAISPWLVVMCSISVDSAGQCVQPTATFVGKSHGIRTDCQIAAVRRIQLSFRRWCLQWSAITNKSFTWRNDMCWKLPFLIKNYSAFKNIQAFTTTQFVFYDCKLKFTKMFQQMCIIEDIFEVVVIVKASKATPLPCLWRKPCKATAV